MLLHDVCYCIFYLFICTQTFLCRTGLTLLDVINFLPEKKNGTAMLKIIISHYSKSMPVLALTLNVVDSKTFLCRTGLTLLDVINFLQREETDDDLHIQLQVNHTCSWFWPCLTFTSYLTGRFTVNPSLKILNFLNLRICCEQPLYNRPRITEHALRGVCK